MKVTKDTTVEELIHGKKLAYIDLDEGELLHWKYIKKKKLPNGKWRYYYDFDSLKKDVKSTISDLTKKTTTAVQNGKKTIKKYASSVSNTVKTTASKISNDIQDTVNRAKKNTYKYIAKVPSGDTYRYFYSDKAYQAYLKGKNAVDKILDKKVNATPSDTAKSNAKSFTLSALFGSFGEAVYNVVAPAFVAIHNALTTPKSFSELKKLDKKQSSDEHQKTINEGYEHGQKYDYSMNCSFCTAAYDLRKRGYDVEANPISMVESYTIEDVCTWYKGAKSVSKAEVESRYRNNYTGNQKDALNKREILIEELKQHGEGARGHLALYWTTGGGHDVIWEVENGEVLIRDCQTGEVSRTFDYINYTSGYNYVRTDNLEPTDAVLRTVRNRRKR